MRHAAHSDSVHAAGRMRALMMATMVFQLSILRSTICSLATRLSAASSVGSAPCVLTRRRNSSLSRLITFVVRSVFRVGEAKEGEQFVARLLEVAHHGRAAFWSAPPFRLHIVGT